MVNNEVLVVMQTFSQVCIFSRHFWVAWT